MAMFLSPGGEVNTPPPLPGIVTWHDGTDAEICAMVQAADEGRMDLTEYWSIGDERQVQLSAMTASGSNDYGTWDVYDAYPSTGVTLVLMDTGHYTLKTPVRDKNGSTRTTCSFVVGQKNNLPRGNGGYYACMNKSNTSTGSWDSCARRKWCNACYHTAIPATLLPIFKQFEVQTATEYNVATVKTSDDWFALFAEKEVTGAERYSTTTEAGSLTQIEYYKTESNRIKLLGNNGSAYTWWLRSPSRYGNGNFCTISSTGNIGTINASGGNGAAPFGCI